MAVLGGAVLRMTKPARNITGTPTRSPSSSPSPTPTAGRTPIGAVHDAYTTWCANEGIEHPLSKRAFSDTLVDNYGAVRKRSDDARTIRIPPSGIDEK